jgi:hypothetical protein
MRVAPKLGEASFPAGHELWGSRSAAAARLAKCLIRPVSGAEIGEQ